MTIKKLETKKIKWIDLVNPTDKEIEEIMEKYNFHELDREAVVEENQRARVDTYEDYLFVVMHFPKFDMKNKRYFNNEFNVFISKKFLITIRWYTASSIEKIFESYKNKDKGEINT